MKINENWVLEFYNLLIQQKQTAALSLKNLHLPKSLFRYRSLNSNHDIENIRNNIFFLSHPDKFNDPYESAFMFDTKFIMDDILKNDKIWEGDHDFIKHLSTDEINHIQSASDSNNAFIKLLLKKYPDDKTNVDVLQKALTEVFEQFSTQQQISLEESVKKGIKLCCFSKRNDSILMWSHYANEHKGICVEYDFTSYPLKNALYPVLYKNSVIDISHYITKQDMAHLIPTLAVNQKAVDWSYEQEWRLAITHGILTGDKVNSPVPSRIYMGSRISDENKDNITTLCFDMKIKLIQMQKLRKEFKIVPL